MDLQSIIENYGFSIFTVAADDGLNLSQKVDDPLQLPAKQVSKPK